MKSTRVLATAGLSLGLVVALQSGCAQNTAVKQAPSATLEAAPPTAEKPAAEEALLGVTGKVVETLQAGGYTYVNVEKDGKKTWAAISSSFPAKAGEEISLKPGMVMKNFTSKTLNRTFEAIVFSDGPLGRDSKQHTTAAEEAQPAPAPTKLSGKVVETMDSGGYTYLNIENDGKTSWAAIPATKVSVGQQVEVLPGMPMQNFTSKTLNRTFDRIDFSSGLAGAPAASAHVTGALPPGHPPMNGSKPDQQPAAGGEAKAATGEAKAATGEAKAEPKKKSGMMAMMMAQSGAEGVAPAGKVVETVDAAGYTYLLIEQDGKKKWAAIPTTKVSVGQELKLQPGTEMKNFTSKSLNKTFESVIFSQGIAAN